MVCYRYLYILKASNSDRTMPDIPPSQPPHLAKAWLHMASPLAWLFFSALCGAWRQLLHFALVSFQEVWNDKRGCWSKAFIQGAKAYVACHGSRLGDIQECPRTRAWQLSQQDSIRDHCRAEDNPDMTEANLHICSTSVCENSWLV